MEKRKYFTPKIEVIEIETEDIIASSFDLEDNNFGKSRSNQDAETSSYRTTLGSSFEESR